MDANKSTKEFVDAMHVSIHAPVMDAKRVMLDISHVLCFNPRARDGRESQLQDD